METRIVWRRGRVERSCLDDLILWLLPSLPDQEVLELAPGRLFRLLISRRRDRLPRRLVVSREISGEWDLIVAWRGGPDVIAACARALRPGGQLLLVARTGTDLARFRFSFRRYDLAGGGAVFDARLMKEAGPGLPA